ncbi:uncharacterized protein LOC127809117 isoform X2 [Diospyros lotus]|uniref:uncharacterized protein LOC127809117 isoform X2 n=1 Tax=Diospyros lotus TaxID=55363 RepID=UPI00224D217B|nr:uncharacterized protein LOC127809117 isoform X2 [Diospyros lotus]
MQGKETAKDEEAIPMTGAMHVTPMSFRLDESHLIHTVETDESLELELEVAKSMRKEEIEEAAKSIRKKEIKEVAKSMRKKEIDAAVAKLSLEERKCGWIEQPKKRSNGKTTDKYYYHIETGEMCRSLIEVYNFIKEGIPIRSMKKFKSTLEEASSVKKKRGASLLKKIVAGSYDLVTKSICLDQGFKASSEGMSADVVMKPPDVVPGQNDPAVNEAADVLAENAQVVPYIIYEFL